MKLRDKVERVVAKQAIYEFSLSYYSPQTAACLTRKVVAAFVRGTALDHEWTEIIARAVLNYRRRQARVRPPSAPAEAP